MFLSLNPNITWSIVKNNLNKPWEYQQLLKNPMKKVGFLPK